MHDIDNTQREFIEEMGDQEYESPYETFEFNDAGEMGETVETESPFNEVYEMELASELIEIQSEAELDQFLGKLIKGATKAVGNFVRSPTGKALGGALKSVAKTAVPLAGRAVGTMVAGPLGGAVGGKLGKAVSKVFEMELDGLSHEDQEFEVAKQFVRLAGSAAQTAARRPLASDPRTSAQRALMVAARTYAPGLLNQSSSASGRNAGRWVRRGNTIVLLGA